MRGILLTSLLYMGLSGAAVAQDAWETWNVETKAEANAVFAPNFDGAFGREGESLLLRGRFQVDADRVLESGTELGARLGLEVQKDHPLRAGFAGGGPIVSTGRAPRGAYTGQAAGGLDNRDNTLMRVETGFVYAKGGYGEVRIGRDRGVAARFREGAPSIFEVAKLDSPSLDPSGSAYVRTDHDLTGPSAKISATTPRLLGVRAGVTFTPTSEAAGLDRNVGARGPGADRIKIENAIEVALNASRRLPDSGVRVRAGVAVSRGEVDAVGMSVTNYGSVETYSAGLSAEFETITIGGSYLMSNNGIRNGNGDYWAWSGGVSKDIIGFTLGADYGASEDDLTGLKTKGWTIGASRVLTENFSGTIGYRSLNTRISKPLSSLFYNKNDTKGGIVVEITLSH